MKKIMLVSAMLLPVILLFSINNAVGDLKINPGEWKYKMKTKIKGLGIPLPAIPVTFSSCITQSNPVMQTPEMKKAGCEIVNMKVKGNLVTYTGRCTNGDSVTDTNFKNTYQENSMEGTFDQVSKLAGKVQSTATGTLTGNRVGACKNK